MISESYDRIPLPPKEKFKHFTKVPSHLSLIEYDDDLEENDSEEFNNVKEINKKDDSVISDDRYEDSFDGKEEETEAESGSLKMLHKNVPFEFDNWIIKNLKLFINNNMYINQLLFYSHYFNNNLLIVLYLDFKGKNREIILFVILFINSKKSYFLNE